MRRNCDELIGEVQQLVEGAFNTGRGFSMMEPPFELEESMARERASEIIDIVTAARDAEIREAYAEVGRYAEKVLGAIGLHGDGTGGQG